MRAIIPGAAVASAMALAMEPSAPPVREAPKRRQAPVRYAAAWWGDSLYPNHRARPLSSPMTDADHRALEAAEAKRDRRRKRNLALG